MEIGLREAIDDPACEHGSAAEREHIQADVEQCRGSGAAPLAGHILHHSESGTQRRILEKTRQPEQARGPAPVGLKDREEIERQGDHAARRRNQRIPARIALRQGIGNEAARDDADAHRHSPRETGDDSDGRVAEAEGSAEVRRNECVEPIGREAPDGDAEHHVQHRAVEEQRSADGAQFPKLTAKRERRQSRRGPNTGSGFRCAARRFADTHLDQNGDRDSRKAHHRAGGSPSPMLCHIASRHGGQKVSQGNSDGVDR